MKTKKILSLLLAGLLALSVAACGQQTTVTNNDQGSSSEVTSDVTSDTEVGETGDRPTEPTGQLVIGTITPVDNDFYDSSFNNNATNYSMYSLIHGYGAVAFTKEGKFEFDPTVVAEHTETENEDGTKTYTVTINDGLTWSDGTPITAKDYVFTALLENSNEITGVDGYPATGLSTLVGYNEYVSGESDTFAGVHLVDDMTYSVTISAAELPNHYDITYAGLAPRPMSVLAPGCDVEDTENGAQITGDFTTELLTETINNADTGYRYHPEITCGPYLLESYDTASRQATLKVNPEYAGDYRGVKPVIETLVIKTVSSDTMVNELETGSVDLLFQQPAPTPSMLAWIWWTRVRPRRPPTSVTATARFSSTAASSPPILRTFVRLSPTAWTATSLLVSTAAAMLLWCTATTAWLSGSIRSPRTGSTRT